MPAEKRRRLEVDDALHDNHSEATTRSEHEEELDDFEVSSGSEAAEDSPDTEDEIAHARLAKSKKTLKRKHRATDATNFGAALQNLLSTNTPSTAPLSLKPSLTRKRNDEKLEKKAKRIIRVEKKEKEDKGRVTDVIGGWGAESERALRKVAQRGVVKLFNAIQQSQQAAADVAEDAKASRGTGKPLLPAPTMENKLRGKKSKHKDNIIGRGKEANLDKDGFLDMIRSGGIVSKA